MAKVEIIFKILANYLCRCRPFQSGFFSNTIVIKLLKVWITTFWRRISVLFIIMSLFYWQIIIIDWYRFIPEFQHKVAPVILIQFSIYGYKMSFFFTVYHLCVLLTKKKLKFISGSSTKNEGGCSCEPWLMIGFSSTAAAAALVVSFAQHHHPADFYGPF